MSLLVLELLYKIGYNSPTKYLIRGFVGLYSMMQNKFSCLDCSLMEPFKASSCVSLLTLYKADAVN